MGVDHGLGGKESLKNRLKREAKARRNKKVATANIAPSRKNEVVFDDAARTAYLTGFHSRKQSRRKYGIAMQVLKEKKARKELSKELRQVRSTNQEDGAQGEDDDGEDEMGSQESIDGHGERTELTFSDDNTNAMFGGEVSVTIDEGIAVELEQFHNPDQANSSSQKKRKREPTVFQKALKAAGQRMQKKYYRQGGKRRLKKTESTKLIHKALGAGVLGSNSFKGGKKKR